MKKKVLLLLAEGFEIYEASAFMDVIGWNLNDGDGSTELFTCGLTKEVKSTFNHRLIVDYLVSEINVDDFSALAIPGGFEEYNFYDGAYKEEFLALIKKFNKKNKTIASICTGVFPIAKSGVLEGKNATTYDKLSSFQQSLSNFGVKVINEHIVVDGNIISSFSPATATNVAFLLLEILTSTEQAKNIKYLMGFEKADTQAV